MALLMMIVFELDQIRFVTLHFRIIMKSRSYHFGSEIAESDFDLFSVAENLAPRVVIVKDGRHACELLTSQLTLRLLELLLRYGVIGQEVGAMSNPCVRDSA